MNPGRDLRPPDHCLIGLGESLHHALHNSRRCPASADSQHCDYQAMNHWALPGQLQKPKAIGIDAVSETRHVMWRDTAGHGDCSDSIRQECATSQRIRTAPE